VISVDVDSVELLVSVLSVLPVVPASVVVSSLGGSVAGVPVTGLDPGKHVPEYAKQFLEIQSKVHPEGHCAGVSVPFMHIRYLLQSAERYNEKGCK